MSSENALQNARALLNELVEAARKGAIIPVRLPGQLEAIDALLQQAENTATTPAAPAPDLDEYMKDQASFISVAIHELRTPMTSIRGYSDMMSSPSMGALTDMQKQFLETIRTNARRMEGLLTDVSDMNKLRGGTLKISPKMDMFKNIAMMVEKNTRPLAESMNRELTFDIPQGLPLLEVDGELLAKAVTKLVENGLRYTPEGGAVVVRGRAEGSVLVIEVQDNGIGMTPDEVAKLGTPYFRSDNDIVRAYKGSGLGVPIAYGIVQVLGGRISVESATNAGTTFTIRLQGMT